MLNPKNLARSSAALQTAQRGFAAKLANIDPNLTDFDIVFVGKYRHQRWHKRCLPGPCYIFEPDSLSAIDIITNLSRV